MTAEEMRWLLRTAAALKRVVFDVPPEDRVILYRFGFETGIRPGQIRQLTAGSFDFDARPPTVTSRAASVKRKKLHRQALRPAMAEALRGLLATKLPDAPAFPTMPDKYSCAAMLREDLAGARAAWIAEAAGDVKEQLRRQQSDFLAPVDHQGRRAAFYSLRHGHGTALGNAGVPQAHIQASLHHTRSATTDRYVHADLQAKARAVNALPELAGEGEGGDGDEPQAAAATGTHGREHDAPRLRGACHDVRTRADAGGTKNPTPVAGSGVSMRGRRDSNPQPPDRQSGTLTN